MLKDPKTTSKDSKRTSKHDKMPINVLARWTVVERATVISQVIKTQNVITFKVLELLMSRIKNDSSRVFFTTKEIADEVGELVANVRHSLSYLEGFHIVDGKRLGKCILWYMILDESTQKRKVDAFDLEYHQDPEQSADIPVNQR